jgi:cobalt-zinc-cadmium efflux system outer membrane protein
MVRPSSVARVVGALVMVTAAAARAETITLDQALGLAERRSPDILEAEADAAVAAGELRAARTIANNPEIGAGVGPVRAGRSRFVDWELSLSQSFELGGKRKQRTRAAEARQRSARLMQSWAIHVARLRTRRAYFLATVARDRLAAAREAETAAEELRSAALDRIRLGGATQLEVNAAVAVAGRARSERLAAERATVVARAELAAAIGAPADSEVEPAGGAPDLRALAASEADFVTRSISKRPDVAARAQDREAAQAESALADALAFPDAALGVSYSHSGLDDADVVLFGLSFRVPLWNRNQGGREAARAAVGRSRVAEESTRREAERQARISYRSYHLAREAVLAFDKDAVEKLGENLELARESFRAGKIGLIEFSVVRRDLIETRFAYLDALAALVETQYLLALAAGTGAEETR